MTEEQNHLRLGGEPKSRGPTGISAGTYGFTLISRVPTLREMFSNNEGRQPPSSGFLSVVSLTYEQARVTAQFLPSR